MQRSRNVETWPQHGGESCGETSQTQGCNIQACDQDCTLAEWSAWSGCSKMCDTGFMQRTRDVRDTQIGAGHCPDAESAERVQYQPCNEQACVVPADQDTLRCDSKLDVILVLDGSASLGSDGWTKVRQSALQLAASLTGGEDGVKVAALLMGGPSDWETYQHCVHGPQGGSGAAVDISAECGVTWIRRLDTDNQGVSSDIAGTEWPETTALTPVALMAADAELVHGRPDAQAVVLVITDGNFMGPGATGEAARRLREKARLMWLSVDSYGAMDDVTQWVSKPVHANAISVTDYDVLTEARTVSSLIADICPEVM